MTRAFIASVGLGFLAGVLAAGTDWRVSCALLLAYAAGILIGIHLRDRRD